MSRIEIAADHEHFTCGGEPFFWVGDTVWSTFTNPTMEEWEEYLDYRKEQGFNVLQINTLPQWDRLKPDLGIYPYPMKGQDVMAYDEDPNPEFIDRARKMCRMAVDRGFHLALVAVWGCIVPGTWMNRLMPQLEWPLEAVEKHVRRIADIYREFEPVYIVSGDTDLTTPETIAYYQRTIEILKEAAPESLRTMHLCGGFTGLTQELADGLDFLIYQSGHGKSNYAEFPAKLAKEMKEKFPGKPVLNSEPCYEGMGKMNEDFTIPPTSVFNEDEVYEACRLSILAGANAGITYGANGVWNWKSERTLTNKDVNTMYGDPLNWREAMHFPGAGRIAGLRKLSGI